MRQEVESHAEVVVLAHPAETDIDGLVVVAVFGVLAEAVGYGVGAVEHILHLLHEAQHGIDVVSVAPHALRQCLIGVGIVDVCMAVVLAVTVVIAVAQLQVGPVGYGFAVGELSPYAVVPRRGVVVTVVLLTRALWTRGAHLRHIGDIGGGELFVVSVAIVSCHSQGEVAAFAVELAVGLQFAAKVGVGAITHVAVGVGVDHDAHQVVEDSVGRGGYATARDGGDLVIVVERICREVIGVAAIRTR